MKSSRTDLLKRYAAVAQQLKELPDMSNGHVALMFKICAKTVAHIRKQCEESGEIPRSDTRIGIDGKRQTAYKPSASKSTKPASLGRAVPLAKFLRGELSATGTMYIVTCQLPTGKKLEVWIPANQLPIKGEM